MGLYEKLEKILKAAADRKDIVELQPDELIEMVNLYIEKAFASSFAHRKDAIHLIEKFPQQVPRKVPKLPRFSSSEQRRRKAQSDAVRDMVIRHAVTDDSKLEEYMKKNPNASYDREYQRLFRKPAPGVELSQEEQASIDAYNEEVAFLFDSNAEWEKMAEDQAISLQKDPVSRVAFCLHHDIQADADLTKEEILNIWARRRATIVMTRFRENVAILNGAEQGSSASLSPQQLAANFWNIKEASQFLAVLNQMIKNGEEYRNMPAAYTEAERAEIGDATRFENITGAIICKFNLIANPMYSYLDLASLENYNFDQVDTAYQDILVGEDLPEGLDMDRPQFDADELEAAVIEEYIAKHLNTHTAEEWHKFFYQPTFDEEGKEIKHPLVEGNVNSGFDLLISDYDFYYKNKYMPLSDKADEYLKNFGLAVRYTSKYQGAPEDVTFYAEENTSENLSFARSTSESDSNRFMTNGIPVVYQLSGRTVILSQKAGGQISVDNLTYENPEALFNYGLKHQHEIFTSQLNDADSMFVKSSPAFKEMKRSLEAIGRMGELKPGQDMAEAEASFQKLLEDTENYLIYKKDTEMLREANLAEEPVADDDRSDYERQRLIAARKIRAFARTKLRELDLIRQAQATLKDFTRVNNGVRVPVDEQTRAYLINRTDLSARVNARIRQAQAAQAQPQPAVEQAQPQPAVEQAQPQPAAEQAQPQPAVEQAQPTAEENALEERYGHADASVASFARNYIVNAIRTNVANGEAISPEQCRYILSNALLYHALCRESEDHAADTAGSLTDMLKHHPDIFTLLQHNLMQSATVKAYLKGVGEMPISMQVMDVLLTQVQDTPLDSMDLSTDVLSADDCTKLLTDEILEAMLRQERAANQNEEPSALETILSSDKTFAEMIAGRIGESDVIKGMISGAAVDGQVSYLAVADLLRKVNEPAFLNDKNFFKADKVSSLVSGLLYDRAEALKGKKGNDQESEEYIIGVMLTNMKAGPYYEGVLKEIEHSEMFHTVTERAGIGKRQGMSLHDLRELLVQMPESIEILNTPMIPTENCLKAVAEVSLNRMTAYEKNRMTAYEKNRKGVMNAFYQPLVHLMKIDPDSRDKLIKNLTSAKGEDSLAPQIRGMLEPGKNVHAISLASMVNLANNTETWALDTMFDEEILDDDMCIELLSDYMLDNMIEAHRSATGKAGSLEKIKENRPEDYAKLRSRMAETSIVRNLLCREDGGDEFGFGKTKRSLEELSDLFETARDIGLCGAAFDKARIAMEVEKRQKKTAKKEQVDAKAAKPAVPH